MGPRGNITPWPRKHQARGRLADGALMEHGRSQKVKRSEPLWTTAERSEWRADFSQLSKTTSHVLLS